VSVCHSTSPTTRLSQVSCTLVTVTNAHVVLPMNVIFPKRVHQSRSEDANYRFAPCGILYTAMTLSPLEIQMLSYLLTRMNNLK
jgi:hypothetical protein